MEKSKEEKCVVCFCLSKKEGCVYVSMRMCVYNHLQCGLKRLDLKGKIRQNLFYIITYAGEKIGCREHA